MKPHIMIITLYLLVLCCSPGSGQSLSDPDRDVIVTFKDGAITPQGNITSGTLSQFTFRSPSLRQTCLNFNVDTLKRLIPNFRAADRFTVSRTGESVVLTDWTNVYVLHIQQPNNEQLFLTDLQSQPDVVDAEPAWRVYEDEIIPNDFYFGNQWGLKNTGQGGGSPGADINVTQAWEITTGSNSVKIGIVDIGMQTTHPDFTGRVTGDVGDNGLHGTVVAGIAAAAGNNSNGVAGVAWNVGIVNADYGDDTERDLENAIRRASDYGAQILNNSYWLQHYSSDVRKAFSDIYKLNKISVVSMGNYRGPNDPDLQYPAAFGQGVITVGATTNQDVRASYSKIGNWIDVVAPGGVSCSGCAQEIFSTLPGSTYGYAGRGTSYAAAMVTGIAALILSYTPSLYNDDVEKIIQLSADDKGPTYFDNEYGYGRVNARKALDLLRPPYYLHYYSATGGTVYTSGNQESMFIYSSSLPDANYLVKRYEVRKNVTYPLALSPKVWGRGVASTGWNQGEIVTNVLRNFAMGFCEPVLGTVTSTGATLRTFVYEVWDATGTTYYGYYPSTPGNVVYAYTLLDSCVASPPQNLTVSKGGTQGANRPLLTWNRIPPTCILGYKIYRNWCDVEFSYLTTVTDTFFTDQEVPWSASGSGGTVSYYVTSYNSSSESSPSNTASAGCQVCPPPPPKAGKGFVEKPREYSFSPNYPNPFNPTTTFRYSIPEDVYVKIVVYDIVGKEIATLVDQFQSADWYNVTFDASSLTNGVYFYKISAGKFTRINKMVLMK